jgi:hypothetical protein
MNMSWSPAFQHLPRGLRVEIARIRLQRAIEHWLHVLELKYSPDQPRVPAGVPTGGQWTSREGWIHLAQAAGPRGPRATSRSTAVYGGRRVELTYRQELELQVSSRAASNAIAEARRFAPGFQPNTTSAYATPEGHVAHNWAVVREAREATIRAGGTPLGMSGPVRDYVFPRGLPIGEVVGRAANEVRTLPRAEFERLARRLSENGIAFEPPSQNYSGLWYRHPDGSIVGFRNSHRNGLTIDIIAPRFLGFDQGLKIHGR